MENENKMKQVNARFENNIIQYLQYLARYQASQIDKPFEYTDLIRQAVHKVFPIPSGFDYKTIDYNVASGIINDFYKVKKGRQ